MKDSAPASLALYQFSQWAKWTIYAVYFLILVGGIVRATGSGMGCPDWPKCFGQWIPPTAIEQLPSDYKETYTAKRVEKNKRVAKMLSAMGFDNAAERIVNDPAIHIETDFNPVKTWIEYINRLIGVVIGLLILLTTWYGFKVRKSHATITWLAVAGLLLVLFQGWLGSIVVSANLMPFTVTLHMLLAVVLVAVLIYALALAEVNFTQLGLAPDRLQDSKLLLISWGLLSVYLIQMVMGTQVREQIDVLLTSTHATNRDGIVPAAGDVFLIHRTFSYILLGMLYWQSRVFGAIADKESLVMRLIRYQQITAGIALITGVTMAYADLPAFAQPLHLLLGSSIVGLQLVVVLLLHFERRKTAVAQPA